MLLSAVSVLVVAQSTSEVPEGLMNKPVYTLLIYITKKIESSNSGASKTKQTYFVVCFLPGNSPAPEFFYSDVSECSVFFMFIGR